MHNQYPSNPILAPQRSWEGKCILIWGSVLWDKDEDLFKVWYLTYQPTAKSPADRTLVCYAVSRNGIDWERPSLGLHEFDGSKDNNITHRHSAPIDTPTIVIDTSDPSGEYRYKMVLFEFDRRAFVRFGSPDGLRWRELGLIELPEPLGDRHSIMFDADHGRWHLYHKMHMCKRTIYMATSEDFVHWTSHGEVLTPSADDSPQLEFYGMVGFRDQGWGLGFLEMFHVLERRLDTELVLLDESGRPRRVQPGTPFLERGAWGEWDHTWAFPGNCAPLRVGEELRIYYQGRHTLHWAGPPYSTGHFGAIGMAKLRPDGYVYLEADKPQATLTTVPLLVTGEHFCINADAREGQIHVELLDTEGRRLEGFGPDTCYPLTKDATYFKLDWRGQPALAKLLGRSICIRFHINRAKLYSFWFSNGKW